ncbi:hypothetical protein [Streptomyces sp. NPDC006510]|uniref:hypothetical protein n=1 Tax=Streptomyces sp. NPDC006510 TaxID=3155600 RepID=UPI00339F66E4
MSSESSRAVLGRLWAIAWDDLEPAFTHGRSRVLLMREHMRRAALWAHACGAEGDWPFFDVTQYIDKEFRLPPALAREQDVRREPTDLLRLSDEKGTDVVYAQTGDIEAAGLIRSAVLGASRP